MLFSGTESDSSPRPLIAAHTVLSPFPETSHSCPTVVFGVDLGMAIYTAVYESKVSGNDIAPSERDAHEEIELLALAKRLAPSNGELVAIKFGDEVLWTPEGWLALSSP